MGLVRSAVLLGSVLMGSGCTFEPEGATKLDTPPIYRDWWAKTEACSGLTANFDQIDFETVPGADFECPTGTCVGRWEPGHHIYLAVDWSHNEMVVRHEMLHELIGRAGHPDPPFGSPCPLTWATWTGDRDGGQPVVE
jgi:hypothetical protein